MNRRILTAGWTVTLALALMVDAGCRSSAPEDATLNTQVQSKLFSDQSLRGEQIQTAASGGVVTLSGTVSSDSARSTAASDAAQVAGVKTVVNNLTVEPPAVNAVTMSPAPVPVQPTPVRPEQIAKSSASHNQQQPAPIVRNQPPPAVQQAPPPAPVAQSAPPPQPQAPPPPQPVVRNITLPAGTAIPVRITQTLDSGSTQTGDKFTGAIASDIVVDGMVVLPQGAPVTGHVDEAKDATHFHGSSLLTISLTSISHHGERIECSSEPYSKEGASRGKNTAEKTGGGAAVGAILGGILGGGKGAAIGAVTGGGVGAGVNGVTRGQQVQIPSESVVRFRLADPIIVRVTTTGGGSDEGGTPGLQHHSD